MHPVERYLRHLREIRATGANTPETSYYPALSNLLNEVGATLRPRVRSVINLQNRGAGLPDGGLFTPDQLQDDEGIVQGQHPARGAIEVKGIGNNAWVTAGTTQVTNYWAEYGQVLVTNYRDFVLVGRRPDGTAVKLEVRWFWVGGLETHSGLKSVFERFSPIERRSDVRDVVWSEPRDDVYLVVPSAEDLGIKWREDELQTKGRRAILGNVVFGDRLQGQVEQWTKWSHKGQAVGASFKPLFSADNTMTSIKVWKHRGLRKVRLDPRGPSQEVPNSDIDRGVNYELTDLKVNGTLYCSLAFEAFPDDSEMGEQFTKLVKAFLAGFDATIFDSAESKSYPAWLDQLAR